MATPLFTFIHVTDTHLSESLDVITPFIEAVNKEQFHPRPDFIVFGGDNIDGCKSDGTVCEHEMPILKKCLNKLQVPYHILCHNHDTWGETHLGTQYRKYFGNKLDYTVELPHGFAAICISGMYMDDDRLIYGIGDRLTWLEETLNNLKDKKVLLFSHVPMFPPRKPVPESHRAMMIRSSWQAFHFASQPEESKPARDIIAKHGNVIAHYTGHCHVHSVTESANTHYITTAALATQPWEYRYIEVFPSSIKHTCFRPHQFTNKKEFWTNCIDEDHPDIDLYHNGLPHERNFTLHYNTIN